MKAGSWQLIEHSHSGRLRPHGHTSYAGLLFSLVLTAVVLTVASLGAEAAPPAVNPQSGSVGLTGRVLGPPPSTAAVIVTPRNGQRTSSIPITVSGTCPATTFVQITKNNAFAGATPCADDGTFSLQIDLFDGANRLIARVSDALGQFGPDSNAVDVFYDAPAITQPGGVVGRQLFLQASTTVVAVSPGVELRRIFTIVGGVGPYAIAWDWGDGASSLASQSAEGAVNGNHAYDRPGNYRVFIKVTDSTGNTAILQLVTVVNGPAEAVGSNNATGLGALPGRLLAAWPLLLLAALMVLLFWLGEWRQLRKLRRQGRLINPV